MAGEELETVKLQDNFYRDGFYKILFVFLTLLTSIGCLIALATYLYVVVPPPVRFSTDNDWRILPPVPLNEPYLRTPDLIQWVSEVLPNSFTFDFVNYAKQFQNITQFYTPNGLSKLTEILNLYVNQKNVESNKLFVNSSAAGAPFILNQGLLQKTYAWWIQMPITINSISVGRSIPQDLVLQALVVRVSTLNNLNGVAIDNLVVNKEGGGKAQLG